MNLGETMVAQISKVNRELEMQKRLMTPMFMDRIQKENADRLEQKLQKKYLRDKKQLEQSGYREIIDILVQKLNYDDPCYFALKQSLLKILRDNKHNEGIHYDNITFSASTSEQLPCCIVFYCTWNSTQREVFHLSYDDNGQPFASMNQFEHTNKIRLSCDQQQAALQIIKFLMTA